MTDVPQSTNKILFDSSQMIRNQIAGLDRLANAAAVMGNETLSRKLSAAAEIIESEVGEMIAAWSRYLTENFKAEDKALCETLLAVAGIGHPKERTDWMPGGGIKDERS